MGGENIRPKDVAPRKNPEALISSPLSPERENAFICDDTSLKGDLEPTAPSTRINEPAGFCSGSDSTYREDGAAVVKSLDSQVPIDASLCHHGDNHQDQNMMMQGDGFEIALGVLMTLGAGDHKADTPILVAPDTEDSEVGDVLSPVSKLQSIGNIGPVSHRVAIQLSTERSVELLRHYRYKIAPWVRQIFLLFMLEDVD